MKGKKKILLIGPYPPPEGGVSVHIQRLLERAEGNDKILLSVFDAGRFQFINQLGEKKNIFQGIFYFFTCDIVHIHISHSLKVFFARVSRIFKKKLFYTIHNLRNENSIDDDKLKYLCDEMIYVAENESNLAARVIPAFIPPGNVGSLPAEIKEMAKGRKIVLSMGSTPVSRRDERDVYGFDLILDAIVKLEDVNLLVLLVDVNGTFEDRYKKRISEINSSSLNAKIHFINHGIDFPSFVKGSDVYVRATYTDGDSLAIREALSVGTPVVTNNYARRPEGCLIYDVKDENDLARQIKIALSMDRKIYPQHDFSEDVFKIYEKYF